MTVTYIICIKNGVSTSNALTAAAYAGFFLLAVAAGTMVEYGGRNRMVNPIALWTTFFMAMAPVGPAVFVEVRDGPLSMLVVIGVFVAASAIAYLIERSIVGGRCGTWYIEYGLAPFAVIWAASLENSGQRVSAIATLTFYWFGHFFYKQIPRLLASMGVKRLSARK